MKVTEIFEATSFSKLIAHEVNSTKHPIVRKLPVAKFYYQGNHTHPVRRTVLVIKNTKTKIIGYEIREGKTVRSLKQMLRSIKTYNKSKIAKYGDYSRLTMSSKNCLNDPNKSTLERLPISALAKP
jgi:hypothetical protein